MKLGIAVFLLLILSAVPRVYAAFYQWTDDNGVIHLTDSRKKIPKKYQKKAKELNPPGKSAPAAASEPSGASTPKAPQEPPPAAAAPPTPGGHPERWWRERFASLRSELKTLQEGLPLKEVRLAELRRERRIYFRARDREAVNEVETEILAIETRIAELTRELEALEVEAARSGVPAEWRR